MKELKKKYSDADMSEVFGKESDEYDILRIVSEERKRVVKYLVVDCVNNVIKNLLHDIILLYMWLFLPFVIFALLHMQLILACLKLTQNRLHYV